MGWTTKTLKCYWRQLIVVVTPILLLPLPITFGAYTEARCAYVILIMTMYWMTEALPLPVTALLPVFAFPVLGILSTKEVCLNYMVDPIILFLGGMMFATAVQYSQLDKRIALFILLHVGKNPRLLMAGFMMITMFLSMWINNAAATALMIPILEAILNELDEKWNPPRHLVIPKITITDMDVEESKETSLGEINQGFDDDFEGELKSVSSDSSRRSDIEESNFDKKRKQKSFDMENLRRCLYLSVAYAANIGGTGVITGSSTNLILMDLLSNSFSEPTDLNFMSWMAFTFPGMIICTFGGWIWLQYLYLGGSCRDDETKTKQNQEKKVILRKIIKSKYNSLGPVSFHEGIVMGLFTILIFLWVFRNPGGKIGWSKFFENLYGKSIEITDSSSVIFIVILLFMIPSNLPLILDSKSSGVPSCGGCLTWQYVQNKIPWGIIILIGGGFAMADGAKRSNLSVWFGQQMEDFHTLHFPVLIFFVTMVAMAITNVASNNATAAILLPVLKDLSLVICSNPLYLMLPVTVCCSYAFMLPVATPPNAIVYYTGKLSTSDMIKAGLGMNIICVIVLNMSLSTLGVSIFNLRDLPQWINSSTSEHTLNC